VCWLCVCVGVLVCVCVVVLCGWVGVLVCVCVGVNVLVCACVGCVCLCRYVGVCVCSFQRLETLQSSFRRRAFSDCSNPNGKTAHPKTFRPVTGHWNPDLYTFCTVKGQTDTNWYIYLPLHLIGYKLYALIRQYSFSVQCLYNLHSPIASCGRSQL
jgi:hypothetical protein